LLWNPDHFPQRGTWLKQHSLHWSTGSARSMANLFPFSHIILRPLTPPLHSPFLLGSSSSMATPGTLQGRTTPAAPGSRLALMAHHHPALAADVDGDGPSQPVLAPIPSSAVTYKPVTIAWSSANEWPGLTGARGSDASCWKSQASDVNASLTYLPGLGPAIPVYWNRQRCAFPHVFEFTHWELSFGLVNSISGDAHTGAAYPAPCNTGDASVPLPFNELVAEGCSSTSGSDAAIDFTSTTYYEMYWSSFIEELKGEKVENGPAMV